MPPLDLRLCCLVLHDSPEWPVGLRLSKASAGLPGAKDGADSNECWATNYSTGGTRREFETTMDVGLPGVHGNRSRSRARSRLRRHAVGERSGTPADDPCSGGAQGFRRKFIVVTGRRITDFRVQSPRTTLHEELTSLFPEGRQLVDRFIAENGGVVWNPATDELWWRPGEERGFIEPPTRRSTGGSGRTSVRGQRASHISAHPRRRLNSASLSRARAGSEPPVGAARARRRTARSPPAGSAGSVRRDPARIAP